MRVAEVIAENSSAKRKKVGCILYKDGNIIAVGYNGTPSGFDNKCEIGDYTKPEVLHAESNALMKIARSTNSSIYSTMYLTCSPCFDCAKLIIQSGIYRLVYSEDYRNTEGIDLLRQTPIIIEKI